MKLKCNCPVCGSARVATAVKKPLGPLVKDGPTVMQIKCRKCGCSWTVPLRVGP